MFGLKIPPIDWWLEKIVEGLAYIVMGVVVTLGVAVAGAILYYMPKGCNCRCNY
tara:strand:- start:49 stop:210 length:162 start_codon:yes stop_codon:yes gene_type:complete